MKRKILLIIILIVAIASFIIPVKSMQGRWVNDSEIEEVGHYMTEYYNIYGIKIYEK